MTEIQDVAPGRGALARELAHPSEDLVRGSVQGARVQVALDAGSASHPGGGPGQVDPPVERDYVGTGFHHLVEHMRSVVHVEGERRTAPVESTVATLLSLDIHWMRLGPGPAGRDPT